MSQAKKKEICNLLNKGIFNDVLNKDVPPHVSVPPSRLFRSIKPRNDVEKTRKARLMVTRHRNRYKNVVLFNATTRQPQFV